MVCHSGEQTLAQLKKEVSRAARDLGYGEECVDAVKAARTATEVNRIMVTARKNMGEKMIATEKEINHGKAVLNKLRGK